MTQYRQAYRAIGWKPFRNLPGMGAGRVLRERAMVTMPLSDDGDICGNKDCIPGDFCYNLQGNLSV